MATKRKAWIHVGMPGAGDVLEPALAHHREALVELGVASIARSGTEGFRAAVEITASHRDWGLKRGAVAGQWARLVRRAGKARADVVFSQPLLATATPDQAQLLVDRLTGYQVHVVVSTGCWAGEAAEAAEAEVVARWRAALRKPERLHVLATAAMAPEEIWRAFGKIVGFGTASLRLDVVPRLPAVVDTLPDALRELERLSRRNAALEVRLEDFDGKRRKLKRTLADRP